MPKDQQQTDDELLLAAMRQASSEREQVKQAASKIAAEPEERVSLTCPKGHFLCHAKDSARMRRCHSCGCPLSNGSTAIGCIANGRKKDCFRACQECILSNCGEDALARIAEAYSANEPEAREARPHRDAQASAAEAT